MSTNKLFDISRRSLLTYQKALAVTSNNVANADNPNYSRQRTHFSAVAPDTRDSFAIGSGVTISDIERMRDVIVDKQVWANTEQYSSSAKQSSILSSIEAQFSEPTELGLSNLLNGFFNSWDELTADPTSSALRDNVVYSAQKMTEKIQSIYEGLAAIQKDLKADTEALVDELNQETKQLQQINEQIYKGTVVGQGVNDLLDTRDELLKSMSEKVNMNVTIDSYGVANVSIGGVFAVDRVHQTDFKVVEESNGKLSVRTGDGNAKLALNGGEVYANTHAYSDLIPSYRNTIEDFTIGMMDAVNTAHSKGYTLTDPQVTGVDFFSGYGDGVLSINEDIIDNTKNIAISADGTNGNNEIALEIANIRSLGLVDGDTISESYNNLVSRIGSEKQFADQREQTFNLVLDQLNEQVASLSGVSIDEEMTNVLKFQRSYDASAKLISVADEILQTLLNI